jgi:DNA-binding protein HU-beta
MIIRDKGHFDHASTRAQPDTHPHDNILNSLKSCDVQPQACSDGWIQWSDTLMSATESKRSSPMAKMTKAQLIDAIAESSNVSKNDVKAVIEHMAIVGYKELNESGEFVIPGFAKMSVVNKPATEARSGINPFTKEPMEFAAKPASRSVKASPLKVAKDAV